MDDRDTLTRQLIDDLSYSYRGVFDPDEIRSAVVGAWDMLEPRSPVRSFLPVLVARQAREQLMATAQAQGKVAKKVPEILFVCVQNAGRSQMAAALAEHLSARVCTSARPAPRRPARSTRRWSRSSGNAASPSTRPTRNPSRTA